MLAGASRVDLSPPLPMDVVGYVRRAVAPRAFAEPLLATCCVLRDGGTTVAIVGADLVGMPPRFADRLRRAVADAIGAEMEAVLINCSHSHAAPWPGASIKLGGESSAWTSGERRYWETLPDAFASAAVQAAAGLREARVAGAVGRASGIAVNRRERTADGRTILGRNPDGFVDEDVPTVRIDALDGSPIATLVAFGCHPVVVGPEVPLAGPDFVGAMRRKVEKLRGGGVTVFLQGAAGNVLPLEAFQDHVGPEVAFGNRLGLEAAHAVVDADPRAMVLDRLDYGSVTPIGLYRRRAAANQPPQELATDRRLVSLPLLEPPAVEELEGELRDRRADLEARRAKGESRATTNPVEYHIAWLEQTLAEARAGGRVRALEGEVWAARLGDVAIVGTPGEIFGEIGHAVRSRSPAATTLFCGYSNGVLGYVATPEEYSFGGYEPAVSHRGYGHPAPFAPEVAGILRDTALALLEGLFAGAAGAAEARPGTDGGTGASGVAGTSAVAAGGPRT